MAQISTPSKIIAGKILRSKITIHLEKYPDGNIYCFLSDGFVDGPVIAGDDAAKVADLLGEKLGADIFNEFDHDDDREEK